MIRRIGSLRLWRQPWTTDTCDLRGHDPKFRVLIVVGPGPPRLQPALFDIRQTALSAISAQSPGSDRRLRFPSRTCAVL
jgi:hypothetical protein